MTDPFWMLRVMPPLGHDDIVGDPAARIDFVTAGKATVFTDFQLDMESIEDLCQATADGAKVLRGFEINVTGASGEIFARAHKQLYVRRKQNR